MSQTPIIDWIGVVVFISTLVFNAEVAAVVGPYMAIIIAAALGAGLSLGAREKTSRANALVYFTIVCTLAAIFASSIAAILAWMHPGLSERALLSPVAFVIGLIGDDWRGFRQRISEFVRDSVFSKRGDR